MNEDTVTALEFMTGLFQLDGCIKNKGNQVLNFNYTFCFSQRSLDFRLDLFFMKANNI